MNWIDRLAVFFATVTGRWRDRRITARAIQLDRELEAVWLGARSVRARETQMAKLCKRWGRDAVARVADVRKFHNLARMARRGPPEVSAAA